MHRKVNNFVKEKEQCTTLDYLLNLHNCFLMVYQRINSKRNYNFFPLLCELNTIQHIYLLLVIKHWLPKEWFFPEGVSLEPVAQPLFAPNVIIRESSSWKPKIWKEKWKRKNYKECEIWENLPPMFLPVPNSMAATDISFQSNSLFFCMMKVKFL